MSGQNGLAPFDYRGYKNWFENIYHAGPFMGIYRSDKTPLILKSVLINTGAETTDSAELSITYECEGIPTLYRIGEDAELTDGWLLIPMGAIGYTLHNASAGDKVIYLQLSDGDNPTRVLFDSIRYSMPAGECIQFEDAAVESICLANFDTDKDGK